MRRSVLEAMTEAARIAKINPEYNLDRVVKNCGPRIQSLFGIKSVEFQYQRQLGHKALGDILYWCYDRQADIDEELHDPTISGHDWRKIVYEKVDDPLLSEISAKLAELSKQFHEVNALVQEAMKR